MDRGAWQASLWGRKSQTRLSDFFIIFFILILYVLLSKVSEGLGVG